MEQAEDLFAEESMEDLAAKELLHLWNNLKASMKQAEDLFAEESIGDLLKPWSTRVFDELECSEGYVELQPSKSEDPEEKAAMVLV